MLRQGIIHRQLRLKKERDVCANGSLNGFFWQNVKDNCRRINRSSFPPLATVTGLRSTMWAATATTGRPRATIATTRTT